MTRHTHAFGFKMSELIKHKQTEEHNTASSRYRTSRKDEEGLGGPVTVSWSPDQQRRPQAEFLPTTSIKTEITSMYLFLKILF